ncbi:Glutaredoxin arsenate reductase [bacterium HR39]|nr:Glutaredoxin arsenate reductase [bacterium HR39]
MAELPGAVLFACTHNTVRSPMAEAILKYLHGQRIYVQSAGVRRGEQIDPFVVEVMDEIGLDVSRHWPRSFDELEDDFFDLVISLSPEAHHRAVELTRSSAAEIEYWPTPDPTLVEGSREQRLEAYRKVRDLLLQRIRERFPPAGSPAP